MRHLLFCLLLVLCFPLAGLASEPIIINKEFKFLNITRQADVFLDSTHRLGLEDMISDAYEGRFKPHQAQSFNFGMTPDTIWLRFRLDIHPAQRESEGLYLGLDKTTFPYVTLYLPSASEDREAYSEINGSYLNRTEGRTLRYRHPVFKIPGNLPRDRYVFISIVPFDGNQHSSANFNLFLSDATVFIQKSWVETGFYYLIFGVLLSMIAYNLFLSVFLKDRVYYFYVGYVAFLLLYLFLRSGFHLVAGLPGLTNLVLPSVAVACMLAIAFSQSFLATKRHCPVLNLFMWAFIALAAMALLFKGLGFPITANWLMHIVGLCGPVVTIAAGCVRLYQGYKPARYYLAAWLSLLAGVFSLSLVGMGYLPKKFFLFNATAIGSVLEAILLSTALGDRIQVLRLEKRQLKQQERRLMELSITDELTGLYNKRWFSSKLSGEASHSQRVSQPLSLILIDVDHFKAFNDTYGHAAGDKVLARLGRAILECLREGDIGCRFGGEEFTILLPATDKERAYKVAERLRRNFGSAKIEVEPAKKVGATISLGVAELAVGQDEKHFFDAADKAMYQAKLKGRNRTERAD